MVAIEEYLDKNGHGKTLVQNTEALVKKYGIPIKAAAHIARHWMTYSI